jgi:hypothetical protein
MCTWKLHYGDFIDVNPRAIPLFKPWLRGRHTRSTPQLPLATPEVDLENIIRKGKAFGGGTSTTKPSIYDDFHCSIGAPTPASHYVLLPSVGVFRSLNFGSVPAEFSPLGLGLEGESLFTPLSP